MTPQDLAAPLDISSAPRSGGIGSGMIGLPAGAVDCHHHIFDPRFQKPEDPVPPTATVAEYQLFKRRIGISRSIVVAPSNYGMDNACLLDAIEQLGQADARGVAFVHPDVSDDELRRLNAGGVRGMRIYLAKNRVPSQDEVRRMAGRAADLGWILQFVGNREREVLLDWEDLLRSLPCTIVIDHMGWAPQPAGVASATAGLLFRLLAAARTYIKLSGLYLSSASGFPNYRDVDALAAALVAAAPEQLLWGTDWPHVGAGADKPDGALLVEKLETWGIGPAARQSILVDAPGRLFWAS
jgi:D-galactarolactone isomerase